MFGPSLGIIRQRVRKPSINVGQTLVSFRTDNEAYNGATSGAAFSSPVVLSFYWGGSAVVNQPALIDRMIRAAKLDVTLYNEVEQDLNATSQALTVVAIGGVSSGLGAAIGAAMFGSNPLQALVFGIVAPIVGWAVWSFVTYFIGTRVFNGTATYGELLRTLGFAATPHTLGIVQAIPCLGWLGSFALGIWALVAGVVAVREALDFDTGKAIATVVIGWICSVAVSLIFGAAAVGSALMGGLLR